ncbi:hypothetical protein NCCP2495_25360 [Dietzia sp. NCCP-2495]|uniref:HtaA domain-containing protein n=1 Tax=Dietzia sp. NCCP-2495 TaxID=2934675 RepID=UPI00222F612B|nr:HtaA domain-containing protein [Dietzia sp. NCCP-2495]GLB64657.1 hypothetical protein NCCP2495_25360 [Dietzia sp. NCCP-2495]
MLRSASRSGAVALTSAALVGLSALAIPAVATADDTACAPEDVTYSVTGGTIEWGFKQSFRSYFFGGFAHGELTTSEGVTFEGGQTAADGRIVWPVTSGSVTSASSATASGTGDANFNAHGGALDTTLSNPTIEINGTEGVLKLDYEGNQFDTSGGTPVPLTGTQVVAATFDLTAAPDLHNEGTTTLTSGPSIIGDDFVEVFGSYPSGSTLDPVTASLTVTSSCSDTGEPGDGDDGGDNTGGGIFGSLGTLFGSLGL